MEEHRFDRDEDFTTEKHRQYREEGWIGGPYTEVVYLLSCLTRINYQRTPQKVWYPAAQEFISAELPGAGWVIHSTYFAQFAVPLLRDLYRQSKLGKRFPIRAEHREERATRFALTNPALSVNEMAKALATTMKQLERNSTFNLARREFERVRDQNSNA